jgi:formylglycine-generating enzyme required for sulfatase activity/serine/threonine protein kinase
MAAIYISSTYEDLKAERQAAARAVHRLGHRAVAMEDYAAADDRPPDKCVQDVRDCHAYVGIFAWRYGSIPEGSKQSITHLEYLAARQAGIPCLIFLLDEEAPWPKKYVSRGPELENIESLRAELQANHTVSRFHDASDLATLVTAAVSGLHLETGDSPSALKEIAAPVFKMGDMPEAVAHLRKKPGEWIGCRFGKYLIQEKLGRGGKGVVFKVKDTLEECTKAVKLVPPQIADSPVAFKELKQEVHNASGIIHANVVKVLGLEEHEGQYFIVMEYVDGRSLEQRLAESKTGKLGEAEVVTIMKKVAGGLIETHKSRVIHRDIKPANIMVGPRGEVKILDFGISYSMTRSMTQLVDPGHLTGTWPYMAPEQFSTRYGRENEQVDIWGFGVTMYQLLTGQLPFSQKDQIKDRGERPFPPEGISRRLRAIILKCLEKDRRKRFQNMQEVLAALNTVTITVTKKPKKPVPKQKKKSPILLRAIFAVALIIALTAIAFLIQNPWPQIPEQEPPPPIIEDPEKKKESIKKEQDNPESSRTPIQTKEKEFQEYFSLANKYFNSGNYDKARQYLSKAGDIKSTTALQALKKKIATKIEEKRKKELEEQDDRAFASVSKLKTIAAYEGYLEQYPNGRHAGEARESIRKLKMPKDVRAVLPKAKGVSKNQKGYWEADFGSGIIMVYIPPGTFTMGSNDYGDEKPPHDVYLDGCWLGKTEVTFDQYDRFCEETNREKPSDRGWGRGKRPVINVSWDDANDYCEWLSRKTGLEFKLPSEAQWEKAARGSDGRQYPWGNHNPYYQGKWYANYVAHDSLEKMGEDGFEYTAPIGSYPHGASPYGLLDMAGNVWEWCADWYDSEYYKNSPPRNPEGPSKGSDRVVRGGGWDFGAVDVRCAGRDGDTPSDRGLSQGFRLCQEVK